MALRKAYRGVTDGRQSKDGEEMGGELTPKEETVLYMEMETGGTQPGEPGS